MTHDHYKVTFHHAQGRELLCSTWFVDYPRDATDAAASAAEGLAYALWEAGELPSPAPDQLVLVTCEPYIPE